MGQGLVGADLDGLAALAGGLRRHGGELERVAGAASGAVGELSRIWEGPDSGQFAAQWSSRHRPALLAAIRALGAAADTVEVNRRQQEQASGSLDGPAGTGGERTAHHGFSFGGLVDRVVDAGEWVIDESVDGAQWLADQADDLLLDGLFYGGTAVAQGASVVGMASNPLLYPLVADATNTYVTPAALQLAESQITPLVNLLAGEPSRSGDEGGRFDTRPNGSFAVAGDTDRDRGQAALIDALNATADDSRIRSDEFQLVNHGNNTYTVVLPGVTDLSRPNLGYDRTDQSVRDVDQEAARSAASTDLADNRYAQMVRDYLVQHDVPPGANLMIVGHSFGADTALDLASDPEFNGGRYNVTHVVAAAYASGSQLPDVQPGTEVLVLQNNKDVPVLAEQLGHVPTAPGLGTNGAVVKRFDGGWDGFGHAQSNYTDYLASGDEDLDAYFTSVAAAGYTASGTSNAVDVSIEE